MKGNDKKSWESGVQGNCSTRRCPKGEGMTGFIGIKFLYTLSCSLLGKGSFWWGEVKGFRALAGWVKTVNETVFIRWQITAAPDLKVLVGLQDCWLSGGGCCCVHLTWGQATLKVNCHIANLQLRGPCRSGKPDSIKAGFCGAVSRAGSQQERKTEGLPGSTATCAGGCLCPYTRQQLRICIEQGAQHGHQLLKLKPGHS